MALTEKERRELEYKERVYRLAEERKKQLGERGAGSAPRAGAGGDVLGRRAAWRCCPWQRQRQATLRGDATSPSCLAFLLRSSVFVNEEGSSCFVDP